MSNTEPTRVMGTPGSPAERTMVAPAAGIAATQQMPAGGIVADPLRTQMGGTTSCPICKATTPLSETYCSDCGFLLASTPEAEIEMPVEEAPMAELVDVLDGRRYRLRPGPNTVGRQGTDILVNEGTVSRTHARILVDDGAVMVEDLGSTNGTKVGDRRIGPNQPMPASHGTPLKFGNWRVLLEVAGGESAAVPEAAERTIAVTDAERTIAGLPPVSTSSETVPFEAPPRPAGEVVGLLKKTDGPADDIPLYAGTITLGRRPTNTVVLAQDTYISGNHAEITTDTTGSYLTDLGSTNGTAVNGQRLTPYERQLLLEGDAVQMGQSKYAFVLVEPSEEQAMPAPDAQAAESEAEAATQGVTSALPEETSEHASDG